MGGWYLLVYSYCFNQLKIKILLTCLLVLSYKTTLDRECSIKLVLPYTTTLDWECSTKLVLSYTTTFGLGVFYKSSSFVHNYIASGVLYKKADVYKFWGKKC